MRIAILIAIAVAFTFPVNGQDKTANKFGKGISVIAIDSSFSLKFSARFQTYTKVSPDPAQPSTKTASKSGDLA